MQLGTSKLNIHMQLGTSKLNIHIQLRMLQFYTAINQNSETKIFEIDEIGGQKSCLVISKDCTQNFRGS